MRRVCTYAGFRGSRRAIFPVAVKERRGDWRARQSHSLPPIRLRKRLRPADSGAPHRVLALSSARITRAIRRAHFHGLERVRRSALSAQRSPLTGCRQKECRSTSYDDFFAGFKFGDAAGFFATFEENLPVCGGFGSPRILIRLRPSPDLRAIMFPNCRRQICLTAVFIHRKRERFTDYVALVRRQ